MRRILLAEDDDEMRRLVADALRKEGYDVLEVDTGDQLFLRMAREYLASYPRAEQPLDLVLTDIRMPGRSGVDVIASFNDAGCRIPVVFMTAFGDDDMRERAAELGATLLDKPFRIDVLTRVVRASLR
jgi:DNA-binding response OmpR family regulator